MKRSLWLSTVTAVLLATRVGTTAMSAQTPPLPESTFRVGDRILLRVEGDSALSDTFTVVAGPALRLPNIGVVTLAGVRRSDVEAHLTRELARYLKDPVVQAHGLVRVSVVGEVSRPGFYAVPVELVLADALMVAGGATQTGRVDRLEILRGSASLWSGDRLQAAIARGATLDELGIRAGDRIEVPRQRDPESKWRIFGIIAATAATVVVVTHH